MRNPNLMTIEQVEAGLKHANYIANKYISSAVADNINRYTPLIIEGDPGTGKTFLAKATAQMLNAPLIRVQIYEGMTYDKILYDYDYQRQLLTAQIMKPAFENAFKEKTLQEALDVTKDVNFYGKDFLLERPIMQALTSEKPCVLLIDEIDKASEELEYSLLQLLEEFRIDVPQYGVVECNGAPPHVFLTSNAYRELSEALKRRCNYLYLDRKTEAEICEILTLQANIDKDMAKSVAHCLYNIQQLPLRQTPSIAEAIPWAEFLAENKDTHVEDTLFMLAKNKKDMEMIIESGYAK